MENIIDITGSKAKLPRKLPVRWKVIERGVHCLLPKSINNMEEYNERREKAKNTGHV